MVSRPLLISIGLHALFAVIAVFGLPMLGRDLPEEMPIVRLEIVRTVLTHPFHHVRHNFCTLPDVEPR